MTAVIDLCHELHRSEMTGKVGSFHPVFIMVSDDQMLDPFELMEVFLRRRAVSKEQIA